MRDGAAGGEHNSRGRAVTERRLLLLFDGWCGVCTRTADWVRRHDTAGRVLAVPSQTPGVLAQTGISRAEADAAAWAITPEGRRFAGAGSRGDLHGAAQSGRDQLPHPLRHLHPADAGRGRPGRTATVLRDVGGIDPPPSAAGTA